MAKAISTEEYLDGVDRNLRQMEGVRKKIGGVVARTHAKKVQDVFGDGISASYSTKPTLAGSNVFGNRNKFGSLNYTFATRAGSNKFFGSDKKIASAEWRKVITGKGARNLMVIEGGYKAIRQADGRRTDKVNLNHTGQLFKDYASSLTGKGLIWVTGVRRKENVGKLQGALDRYGDAPWTVDDGDISDKDLEILADAISDLLII